MTPLVKAGVIGGILTSLAGAGYASTYLFPSPTKKVSDLITRQDLYMLLKTGNNEDTTHWTKAWEAYKKDNNGNENDIFGLEGWKSDGSVDVTAKLKEKCGILKGSLVYDTDDSQYKNITKYCGRAITVEDEAKKDSTLTIINTETSGTAGDWDNKHTNRSNLKAYIEKLGMTFSGINANQIKEGCKVAKTKDKVTNKDQYSGIYEAYKKVCTK
ncbi:hypothetical protein A6V39_01255 [Candidatus Mycoplasma haematobovis]|uniref:Uncharacterized protein n=1 Tax=Candidatus Mycoplasma haematobovis TaxID=432608 RepID=A0A1A9QF91_9MOLU|nr:hypothetical protein [Candidatus Mycoplasma haematobovis]OAL10681.1 hypothetical protein A6V39_01255 [Candidatus Mycoplasma haematobovis]